MKTLRTILVLVLVALLGGATFWLINDEGESPELASLAAEGTAKDAKTVAADLDSPSASLAAGGQNSARQRDDATSAVAGPVALLEVSVAIPSGAPLDETLEVVALPRASLAGKSHRDWLANPQGDFVRSAVSTNGTAQVEAPFTDDWIVLIDGKFLFLEDPVPAQAQTGKLKLKPRLGAYLSGEFASSAKLVPQGKIALMGMNFGSRGGMSQRSIELESQRFEFRGVDCDLTWMLMPELETAFADSELGLEFEPGVELFVSLELLEGATVRGIVTDDQGTALEGARVRVANDMPWMPGGNNDSTETDSNGAFELSGLSPGNIRVQASMDGRVRARSDELTLADGQVLTDLQLLLSLGASIRGTVRFPDGEPAVGARVEAETLQSRNFAGFGGTRRQTVGETKTDDKGAFVITGLSEGRFTLRARHDVNDESSDATASDESAGSAATWRSVQENIATGAEATTLTLVGPVPFSGRVVDDLDQPVTTFNISARSAEDGGPRENAEFTDEEGRFTFAKAGPGDWRIQVRAEGYSQAEAVELELPTTEAELILRVQRRASISGRVITTAGKPLATATVQVESGSAPRNPWQGPSGPSTEVDAEGRFELTDLAPGDAKLTASADGWADSEAFTVALDPGARIEDVVLTTRIGGRIVGSVLTPEGDPQPGRRVTWGQNSMGFGSDGETTSAADGSFRFEHVTPGDWSVSASPSMAEMGKRMRSGDAENAWVDVMGQLLTETVTITDGETTEVYLGGEPRIPVRVIGSVTRAGEPVSGAQVYAVSEGTAIFQGMKSVRSDADGNYSLEVDRPGAYVVSARVGNAGVEVVTDIPRGEEARIDLAIPQGGIEGFVEQPDGKAAQRIRIQLQREDGLGRLRWGGDQATTDEEGHFSFNSLEPGRYTVRANIASWNGRADDRFGTHIVSGIEVEADAMTSGIDFKLAEAGTVEGIVESTDGSPVSGASIFFRDSAGRLVTNVSSTLTDGLGKFKKTGLAPGDYTLSARGSEAASADQTSIRVSSSQAVEARLVVETGTTIVVKLEDPAGDARRARIEVFDENDREVGGLMTLADMQRMFNEGTSSLEREVGPLPPGRYTVRATTVDGRVSEKSVRLNGRRSEKSVRLKLEE